MKNPFAKGHTAHLYFIKTRGEERMDRAIKHLRVSLAQVNVTVGDLDGNVKKILQYTQMAKDKGAHVVAFPELAITGYPPEDLLLKPQFIEENIEALHYLADQIRGITAVVGFVDAMDDIYNAAAIIHDGEVQYRPSSGVLEEIISSGKLGIFRNDSLRISLSSWRWMNP